MSLDKEKEMNLNSINQINTGSNMNITGNTIKIEVIFKF
jgi:hypothetical protein